MKSVTIIIFGATGDLTHRKLIPSLFSMFQSERIPENVTIIGVGRRKITEADFCENIRLAIGNKKTMKRSEKRSWNAFEKRVRYIQGFFEEDTLYSDIGNTLLEVDKKHGECGLRMFYLATPPALYETILQKIYDNKLTHGCGQEIEDNSRILIEKPFGRDVETARHLDELLGKLFKEEQIYRIDHYLAKESVQNILAFRFANGIFEPTWNKNFIDHIQITVSETLGMEGRGSLYEGIGALRDVMQNHIMQLLSVIAMEQPRVFDAVNVRLERQKVMHALVPLSKETIVKQTVRGQYVSGLLNGKRIAGYREEAGVDPKSKTETFTAIKVFIDSARFAGVPFYLRTGKRLKEKVTEISIHYKKPALCNEDVCFFDPRNVRRNVLAIRIEPNDTIALRLMAKEPGLAMSLTPIQMDVLKHQITTESESLDAYEKLLLDALNGDQMLFAQTREIAESWKFMTPILDSWSNDDVPLSSYQPGTMGPGRSHSLLDSDGRYWYLHEK